jgi:hypothetical protein
MTSLSTRAPNQTETGALSCAYGTPWLEHWIRGRLFTCMECNAKTASNSTQGAHEI